jgi:tetratricopeptide (TPR) repeat protein
MRTSSFEARTYSPALVVCALAVGCATVPNPAAQAERSLAGNKATPRQVALVGLSELDRGHVQQAVSLARTAMASHDRDELALLLSLILAERDLDTTAQETSAAALLRDHPASSFSRLAAVSLARLAGQSTQLDQLLSRDLAALLQTGALDAESRLRVTEALASIALSAGEHERAAELRQEIGLVSSYSVVGPLSPYHYLEFDRALPPERAPAAASYGTPWGAEAWRSMRFANGLLPLGHALGAFDPPAEESRARPPSGDVFYAKTTFESGGSGTLLCVESSASVRVFVDGQAVLTRDLFRRPLPRASWVTLSPSAGKHQLLVKAAVGDPSRGLRVYARPLARTVAVPASGDELFDSMRAVVGDRLAAELASRSIAGVDPHAALALLPKEDLGTIGLAVRSELWAALDTLRDEDARARSERDLDALLALDSGDLPAHLRRAQLLSDSGRTEAAARDFLGSAPSKPSAQWLTAQAKLRLAHDAAPLALGPLLLALTTDPGDCQALELTLSLLDQMNAFSRADRFAEGFARCPGGQLALAQRRATQLGPNILASYWSARLERSPSDPDAAAQLADAWLAQDRPEAAEAALMQRLTAWPEDLEALRKLGQMRMLVGQRNKAHEAFDQVLSLDGADLQLRRDLALLDGRDILDDLPTIPAVLAGKRWVGPSKASQATFLDSGAAAIHLDGSVTERVRSLQRPLDEAGLTQLGELELPPGATLVALRTHKADGRVLDAEAQGSGEKKTLSVAALSVGDDLETDYLMSTPPSRRGSGGSADGFFFQAEDSSLQRSYYLVHSDGPAVVDTHRVQGSPPRFPGVWSYDATLVPALPAEPQSVPPTEFLPWVQVGTGDTASDLARSVADGLLPKQLADEALLQIVAPLRRIGDPAARAEALWSTLSQAMHGDSGSLGDPVSEILSRGSGNLLLPMKAGLDALGITSHILFVNGPSASIEPRRFLQLSEYTDSLLGIDLPGHPRLYLATSLRFAPFGRAPPQLCDRAALELPNGDEPGRVVTLPPCPAPAAGPGQDLHKLTFVLRLGPDGEAEGEAEERFEGFTASGFRSSLEQLDDEQRRQGVESALASVFRGVELVKLSFVAEPRPGAPLVVTYRFKAPNFATPDLGEPLSAGAMLWSVPLRAFPAKLGERFVQLASRQAPLLIAQDDRSELDLRVFLPVGSVREGAPAGPLALEAPFGLFRRSESIATTGETVVREVLMLPSQRIAPGVYGAFAGFAASVDEAQNRRLRYRLKESKQPSAELRMQVEPGLVEHQALVAQREQERVH